MLGSEVETRVRKIAGDVDSLQFSQADIVTWINDALKECASDNNLLQKSATSAGVIGQIAYALPTDILRLHSVRYNNEKLDILSMEEFDKYVDQHSSTTQGTPAVAYVWANQLNLFPAPDTVYNLKVEYTRLPVEVTVPTLGNELDLPKMYHRRIVDYCLAIVAEQDDDMDRYAMKMQEFRDGIQRLRDDQEHELDQYPSMSVSPRDAGGVMYDYD